MSGLVKRNIKPRYDAETFITAAEAADVLKYSPKDFTDAKRRADFGFEFTVIRPKQNSNSKILLLRSEFNEFVGNLIERAKEEK